MPQQGSRARRSSRGDASADAVVELWRSLAVKTVVFDADVLGRQRTGDETYALNLLRELGALARRRICASSP